MKFRLKLTDYKLYHIDEKTRYEQLGFKFAPHVSKSKFDATKFDLDDDSELPIIEINSLEELMELKNKVWSELIIAHSDDDLNEIEIYNGYRE